MVVPVSTRSTTASARPRPHAASTEPETYFMPNVAQSNANLSIEHNELKQQHLTCLTLRSVVLCEELSGQVRIRGDDALARELFDRANAG